VKLGNFCFEKIPSSLLFGIVVSGASVQDKPEAHKRGFPKATVEGFHTKGWINFFFCSDSLIFGSK
jgi:hypothetical protein